MKGASADTYLLELRLERDKIDSYKDYPFSIPAVKNLSNLKLHPKVTFFIGENGAGKSTLMEAMALNLNLNPEGGSKNFSFATRESHSTLNKYLRIAKSVKQPKDKYFLRAESYFNVATEIETIDKENEGKAAPILPHYGGISLHEQSHGESFLKLFTERLYGDGVYLLDEPEAALSPTRQLAALRLINDLVNKNSQFVICTHSPIIMGYPDAWIYQFSETGISRIDYRETEHYAITKEFLERRESMLDILFEDD